MANSVMLLDLTLNELEGQNAYRIHFSTQPPQNRVQPQQIFMDDFHIWKRISLGYHTYIFVTLYLETHWSQSKTDQNLGLWGKYLVYIEYMQFLTVKCSNSVLGHWVHFCISGILYVEKQWLQSEWDQNFSLRGKSFMHTEHLSLLSVQCQFGVITTLPVFDDLVSTVD